MEGCECDPLELSSYEGGGANSATRLFSPGAPASNALCKSERYRSWNVRLCVISIATLRKSAAARVKICWVSGVVEEGVSGALSQMTRARSCCCAEGRAWMIGTVDAQRRKKGRKTGGQVSALSTRGADEREVPGMGTLGGVVLDLRAAK